MDQNIKAELISVFKRVFGDEDGVRIFFAPGRVNLIGEHTDYNGGHVFPCALSLGTYAAVKKRNDKNIRLYSMNFEKDGVIEADASGDLENSPKYRWANYPLGIVETFRKRGMPLKSGFDILFYGTIPNGSGLSSSASIEVLTGYCLKELYGFDVTRQDLALIGQDSENNFNGMNCGIMDQFASAFGKAGHAIFLDTATLKYEYVPVDLKGIKIVISNTNVKHELTSSGYNDRRRESETALKDLQTVTGIKALGELDKETFDKYSSAIKDEICYRRARHAVTENLRTIEAVKALNAGELATFGHLMNESHASLDKDYEVTCPELNIMAETEQSLEGVIGARMTGGGFGGCTVALVREECVDSVIEKTKETYISKTGITPAFYVVDIGDGPREII